METEQQKKFMKLSLVGIGFFLLSSLLISVMQNTDSKNGYYSAEYSGNMYLYSMRYSKGQVEITESWTCGETHKVISGKPSVRGNSVLIFDTSNPSQKLGELIIISDDTFTMVLPTNEEPITVAFNREPEPRPWRRLLIRLGFPPSVIP